MTSLATERTTSATMAKVAKLLCDHAQENFKGHKVAYDVAQQKLVIENYQPGRIKNGTPHTIHVKIYFELVNDDPSSNQKQVRLFVDRHYEPTIVFTGTVNHLYSIPIKDFEWARINKILRDEANKRYREIEENTPVETDWDKFAKLHTLRESASGISQKMDVPLYVSKTVKGEVYVCFHENLTYDQANQVVKAFREIKLPI